MISWILEGKCLLKLIFGAQEQRKKQFDGERQLRAQLRVAFSPCLNQKKRIGTENMKNLCKYIERRKSSIFGQSCCKVSVFDKVILLQISNLTEKDDLRAQLRVACSPCFCFKKRSWYWKYEESINIQRGKNQVFGQSCWKVCVWSSNILRKTNMKGKTIKSTVKAHVW